MPASRSEAGERGELGPRSAPELAPPAEQCAGDAAAANAPVMPVASHAVAQNPGAGHAGALLPRPELNGNAAPFPTPSCAPVAIPDAGLAAPSSDEGHAPQLLPPTDLPESAPVPAPILPVAASSESQHHRFKRARNRTGRIRLRSCRPAGRRPHRCCTSQRQRELIEQAAGMSTRQVAGLLAAAAPEVVPPRDTLRTVAPRPLHLEGDHRSGVRTGTAPAEGSAVAPRPAHVVGRPGGAPGARGGGAVRPARRR